MHGLGGLRSSEGDGIGQAGTFEGTVMKMLNSPFIQCQSCSQLMAAEIQTGEGRQISLHYFRHQTRQLLKGTMPTLQRLVKAEHLLSLIYCKPHSQGQNREIKAEGPGAKGITALHFTSLPFFSQLEKPRGEAPLASFQEDTELSSSEGSPSSHLSLQGRGSSQRDQPPLQCPTKKPSAELPSYEDFASIDSSVGEGQEPGQEHPVAPAQSHPSSIPPPRGCAAGAGPVSKLSGPRAIQSREEEDDLYYGVKEGLDGLLMADDDSIFEPET